MTNYRYYDLPRHWTRKIEPHLGDKKLNDILVRDFNKYTTGISKRQFARGQYPYQFESCDWNIFHRGPHPRYWRYVKHAACHWLVNFNLRLAQLVEPDRPWRIVTSEKHSTVWDGSRTIFEFNFLAFGTPADECFALANGLHLLVGKQLRVYMAEHWSVDRSIAS